MKHILSLWWLVLTLMACQRQDVGPDVYIKPLNLYAQPTPDGLLLNWEPVFIFEEGMFPGPTPVSPAQYEVYVSDTNRDDLHRIATLDGTMQRYAITNMSAGKTLYVQIKAVHPILKGSGSPVVTTNVGPLGDTNLVFPQDSSSITWGDWGTSTLLYSTATNKWALQSASGTTRILPQEGYSPILSPDERSIAYVSGTNTNTGNPTQIWIKSLDSGLNRLVETKTAIYGMEWSSDSQSIAFMAYQAGSTTGVWLRQLSQAASTQLYSLPAGSSNQLRTDQLAYSPDGQSIVVSLQIPLPGQVGSQLLKIPTRGGSPQGLLESSWSDTQPTYSPDGTRLAFISRRSGYEAIWVAELPTGTLRQLTGRGEQLYYSSRLDWKTNRQLTYTASLPSPAYTYTSLKVVTLPN